MKTVFKVGMEVYDQLVFPDKEGKVISVVESDDYPIKVHYEGLEINELSYTADGRYYTDIEATLATKPYIFEGFEQKASSPTYEDAQKWIIKQKEGKTFGELNEIDKNFINYSYYKAFESLKKLIILRDYYNEGWQPDWTDESYKEILCFETDFHNKKGFKYRFYASKSQPRVLAFKNSEIRERFFKEQKELLEIAKPLL